MKRIGLWAMGMGLISCVGVGTVEFAYANEKEHGTTCSLATVEGRYLFATNGTNFLTPAISSSYSLAPDIAYLTATVPEQL